MRNILVGIVIGLIIGWIFPVEGPIDYVYDDYATKPAHKHPIAAPAPKLVPEFDLETMEELNEEWEKEHGILNPLITQD